MAKVGKELGIFTAGTKEHHNGCTVMYGAEGMIWSKPAYHLRIALYDYR
jgi:hypothetical protein